MEPPRTPGEQQLLTVTSSAGLDKPERRRQVARAANWVLAEALRTGYRFEFHEDTGLRLLTPSGLLIWFCIAHEFEGLTTLILDLRAERRSPDQA